MAEPEIFLGNDWDIHREGITNRGKLVPKDGSEPVTRGYLALAVENDQTGELEPADAPIHAELEVNPMEWLADGEVIGGIEGWALTDHLTDLLDTAEAAGEELIIFDRVEVPDQNYRDDLKLVVRRHRAVTLADE